MKSRRAFTVIELVTIVAVSGLVVGLLLPSLRRRNGLQSAPPARKTSANWLWRGTSSLQITTAKCTSRRRTGAAAGCGISDLATAIILLTSTKCPARSSTARAIPDRTQTPSGAARSAAAVASAIG